MRESGDAQIQQLLRSSSLENVRLGLQLAMNPAIRLDDLSDLVRIAMLHADDAFRADAFEAIALQSGRDVRGVLKTYWERTHPQGRADVLYRSLKQIEQLLELPRASLQVYAAGRWGICPEGCAQHFPEAFAAWCAAKLVDGRLVLEEPLGVLPRSFLEVEGLRVLEIRGKALRKLPEWMGEVKGVEKLVLVGKALRELPMGLAGWDALEEVRLEGTGFGEFPRALQGNGAIRRVSVVGSKDDVVGVGILDKLEVLDVDARLERFPEWVEGMVSLKVLRLEWRLGGIGRLDGLLGLEELVLKGGTGVVSLPEGICGLKGLRVLVVGGRLKGVPAGFEGLGALRELDLSGSPLVEVPEAVLGMKELEVLKLNHCGLGELPGALGGLGKLKRLEVGHNGFVGVPEVLHRMGWLEVLDLRNNRLPLGEVNALREGLRWTRVAV